MIEGGNQKRIHGEEFKSRAAIAYIVPLAVKNGFGLKNICGAVRVYHSGIRPGNAA
jgi:hypothetical protein